MKTLLLAFAASLAVSTPAMAQQAPDHHAIMAAQAEAMQPFDWMVGKWRGHAWQMGPGGRIELIQTERVGPFLAGSVRVVEGRGYDPATGKTEFNALGVINYDLAAKTYTLSASANGQKGDFPIELREGGFDWFIDRGPVKLRYEARLEDGKWHETGYLSMPGRDEVKFFEMTLERIGDSDWPMAGTVGMAD